MEQLIGLDAQWLLAINGCHNAFFDAFMWHVSKMSSWILIAIVALIINLKHGWKPTLAFIVVVGCAVGCADFISSGIIKNAVQRLRPTHNPAIESLVHVVRGYRGGQFGFVSSHAANSFAAAVTVGLILPHRATLCSLLAWACLQCYSRMYLGVHYPGDILGGLLVGLACAAIAFAAWKRVVRRFIEPGGSLYTVRDAHQVTAAVWATVVLIAIAAIFQ